MLNRQFDTRWPTSEHNIYKAHILTDKTLELHLTDEVSLNISINEEVENRIIYIIWNKRINVKYCK